MKLIAFAVLLGFCCLIHADSYLDDEPLTNDIEEENEDTLTSDDELMTDDDEPIANDNPMEENEDTFTSDYEFMTEDDESMANDNSLEGKKKWPKKAKKMKKGTAPKIIGHVHKHVYKPKPKSPKIIGHVHKHVYKPKPKPEYKLGRPLVAFRPKGPDDLQPLHAPTCTDRNNKVRQIDEVWVDKCKWKCRCHEPNMIQCVPLCPQALVVCPGGIEVVTERHYKYKSCKCKVYSCKKVVKTVNKAGKKKSK